jgi:hypothetical protein
MQKVVGSSPISRFEEPAGRVRDVMAARGAQLTGLSRSLAISVALSARL